MYPKIILAAAAVLSIALAAPAEARRHHAIQDAQITCDSRGCSDYDRYVQPPTEAFAGRDRAAERPRAHSRAVSHSAKSPRTARHSPEPRQANGRPSLPAHGLVSIQCGKGNIKVAASAATQFEGFCRELWASYHWAKGQGGWRPGHCATGSKHPCGGAIDVEQWCRSCVTKAFPVKLSEQIADKWGLWPGSRWGYRDTGHFEIRGALASNGWKPKEAFKLASLPPEPAPKHWPMTVTETVPVPPARPVEIAVAETPPIAFYPYAEYLPEKPAKIVLASLNGVPIGTPREEVNRAADAFGLDRKYMRAVARIESGFDPRQRTGQYAGLFQLSRHEFNKYGEGETFSARDNSVAMAAKLVNERVEFAQAVGRDPDRGDLYLVHQQGLGGAIAHLTDPDRVAWRSMCTTEEGHEKGAGWCRKAIWGNVLPAIKRVWKSVEKMTSGAFVAMWRGRIEEFYRGGDENVAAKVAPARVAFAARAHHHHHYAHHHHRKIRMASR